MALFTKKQFQRFSKSHTFLKDKDNNK